MASRCGGPATPSAWKRDSPCLKRSMRASRQANNGLHHNVSCCAKSEATCPLYLGRYPYPRIWNRHNDSGFHDRELGAFETAAVQELRGACLDLGDTDGPRSSIFLDPQFSRRAVAIEEP